MTLRVLFLITLLATLLCAAPPNAPPPDFSSPRAALKSFYQAVESADIVSIRAALLSENDQQRKLADAFTNVIAASQKLASAAREKFGAAGDSMQISAIPKDEIAKVDAALLKIDGDDATLQIEDRPRPIQLHKTQDAWKIRVMDFAGATPANISAQIDLLDQLAQILSDTAAGIA